jgi:hypothetical protein
MQESIMPTTTTTHHTVMQYAGYVVTEIDSQLNSARHDSLSDMFGRGDFKVVTSVTI